MIYLLLITPALTLVLIVFGFPIVRYSWLSLHSYSVLTGLDVIPNTAANWVRLLNDDRFWQDAIQTIRFSTLSVSIELVLAIAIALILHQKIKRRGLVRALSLLPWALPTTIMALGWRWIFNTPYGPLENILNTIGVGTFNFLGDPRYAWLTTVIADVWKTTPFIALLLLAGLQSIPKDLYEAFKLEGGNSNQSFLRITLPLLEPYIILSLLFRIAQAFGVFDLIQVMTGGGPAGTTESLGLYAYLNAMRFLDFGYSATVMLASFILLVFYCLMLWILLSISKRIYELII